MAQTEGLKLLTAIAGEYSGPVITRNLRKAIYTN